LRAEAKSGTPLGLRAQKIIRAGGLAPDDVIMQVVRRMEEYRNKTLPVTDFYERAGILARVNGDREAGAVSHDIERLIEG
jgi:adenylate kinase family enzyme